MLTYLLDVNDMAENRFVVSPLHETAVSIFTLTKRRSKGHRRAWLAEAHQHRERYDYELITALNSPSGRQIPDFLTPLPTTPRPSIDTELHALATTDPAVVHRDLVELAEGQPPGPILASLLEDPERARMRIAEALAAYSAVVIAPHWREMARILESDITFRGRELALGGPVRLFESLTPKVVWEREGLLRLAMSCSWNDDIVRGEGRGLTLIPSVFVFDLSCPHDPLYAPPQIAYPARGTATLDESITPTPPDSLRRLIGGAKAEILVALSEPRSVADLAVQLGVSSSAISQSLRVLSDNGLVERSRHGREVLYRRSDIGQALVARDPAALP